MKLVWSSLARLLISFFTLPLHSVLGHWIDLHSWAIDAPASLATDEASAEGLVGIPERSGSGTNYVPTTVSADAGKNLGNSIAEGSLKIRRSLPACRELVGILSDAQLHMCELFSDHLGPLVQGASLGLHECRWQFRYHHWNCSGISNHKFRARKAVPSPGHPKALENRDVSSLRPATDWGTLLRRGSKEIAFAQAVWSAAVAQSISRWCRDGSLSSCGCGRTDRPKILKDEWRWGGCSDNLQYGYKFSQSFVDSPELEMEAASSLDRTKALANLHNNEAGRRSVLKKTKVACKCHGVSGSCALVTCWFQLSSFREIGDYLKQKYAQATAVKLNKRGRLQVKRESDLVPTVHDLVFVQSSPNYCERDHRNGVAGTSGRLCNTNSSAPDNCKALCCNRGHTTRVIQSTKRCKCRFTWCCKVTCEECSHVQSYNICK